MLFSDLLSNPLSFIVYIIVLLVTIAVHEFAHAKVADELGDPTPRLNGRLTLNPVAHIDPIGLMLLFLVGFGWGKPVPFDPFNLKSPRRDAAFISIAGPLSNFLIAILFSILLRLYIFIEPSAVGSIGLDIGQLIIGFNIMLGVFNLIPIAPLDGFKIVGGFLSEFQAREWYKLERYGIIFLLLLIFPFFGTKSMLQLFLIPVLNFFTQFLLP